MCMKKIIKKRIVFPEGEDTKVLKAADFLSKTGIVELFLLGNVKKIYSMADRLKLKLENVVVIDHLKSNDLDKFAKKMAQLRKIKICASLELIKQNNYFGMIMLKEGDADILISGAAHSTKDVLVPAFQIMKKKGKASGAMWMSIDNKHYLFSDIAVQPDPDSKDLAEIALLSARTFENITDKRAKVAMLSFSTKGSAKHALINKIKKAVQIAKKKNTKLIIDGELQLDAAVVPWIGKIKNPKGIIRGNANVLIFPDLNSANIGYKLVERFCDAKATGVIIQGLSKPIYDLSRGCSVEDIVDVAELSLKLDEK